MPVSADFGFLGADFSQRTLDAAAPDVLSAQRLLASGEGPGADFIGWRDPSAMTPPDSLEQIKACAARLAAQSDAVLCVGIGGSYLGARAALEYLRSPYYNHLPKSTPDLWFVGNSLSASQMGEVLTICAGRRISVIVVSKSGTTTEPAAAFRLLRAELRRRYGAGAGRRIVAVTDPAKGALRAMAGAEGWETLAIPENVGGRFSVLTPAGLLPLAVAGIDIDALLTGAQDAAAALSAAGFEHNAALQYAAARLLLLKSGRAVELFCGWDPAFAMTAEWLRQLFGESEGKHKSGLFPAAAGFSADLHSLGQFLQDGSPVAFETVVCTKADRCDLVLPHDEGNGDGLDYLAGKSLGDMSAAARRAVAMAHLAGGTPSILLETPERSPFEYGWMLYFFQYACAVGAYALGVNPFDQPGVEDYKQNLFALLGRPGHEDLARRLGVAAAGKPKK